MWHFYFARVILQFYILFGAIKLINNHVLRPLEVRGKSNVVSNYWCSIFLNSSYTGVSFCRANSQVKDITLGEMAGRIKASMREVFDMERWDYYTCANIMIEIISIIIIHCTLFMVYVGAMSLVGKTPVGLTSVRMDTSRN